jgi:hypothetical protein
MISAIFAAVRRTAGSRFARGRRSHLRVFMQAKRNEKKSLGKSEEAVRVLPL